MKQILDSIHNLGTIRIVETGFYTPDVLMLADWAAKSANPVTFYSVGMNLMLLEKAHTELDKHKLLPHCNLLLQDPLKHLSSMTWLDAAFLNSRADLQYGAMEFRAAASAGAHIIAFNDYQTKGASAIAQAKANGWKFEQVGVHSVLRRW